MGFFDDIKDLLGDDLDDLIDDAGSITVEVVTSKADLDKRISELEADGFKLTDDAKKTVEKVTEEEPDEDPDDLDEMLEYYRKEALRERAELIKKYGEEKVRKITDLALHCATIHSLMEKNIPLDQSMVDEYNSLCREVHPERCDDFVVQLIYMMERHTAEKGLKELG